MIEIIGFKGSAEYSAAEQIKNAFIQIEKNIYNF